VSDTRLSGGVSDRTFGREPNREPSAPRSTAPNGGPVSYELASWGVRAAAFAIDMIFPLAIGIGIGIGVYLAEGEGDDARRLAETLVLAIGVPFSLLYAPLLLIRRGRRNGQTLGKQAMRIRVVRERGEQVTFGNALLREVIGRQLLVAFTYGLYAVVDYLWPTWDRARQCLHDKVAQTRVVRVEEGAEAVDAFGQPAARPYVAPAPPPPERRAEDDQPVRPGWLPPAAG
jgi:uncharacterized RDD family membrane protein YckC